MAIIYTHTFELKADDFDFGGEISFPSGVYTEISEKELPANLETDFKLILESLAKLYSALGGLKFEVKAK